MGKIAAAFTLIFTSAFVLPIPLLAQGTTTDSKNYNFSYQLIKKVGLTTLGENFIFRVLRIKLYMEQRGNHQLQPVCLHNT